MRSLLADAQREADKLDGIASSVDEGQLLIKPVPLDGHRPRPFPSEIFTGWLGKMIKATSAATETPIELSAMMGLAVLGTACQKTICVRPEPGYFEPLNIWTVSAMDSGNRKSAVLTAMTRPLIEWERERAEFAKIRIAEVESDRKTKEQRIKNLRARHAKAKVVDLGDVKRELAALEMDLPEVPALPRLWAQDVTPEKLGNLMADNDEKMAVLSDEGGIFSVMAGRYSSGIPNLDVFLQSHAGTAVRVDRGTRESVYMNHPALTIGLSPQPQVLKSLNGTPEFRGRGLLARFLYALPTSSLGYRKLTPQPVPESVEAEYGRQVRRLLEIHPVETDGDSHPNVLSVSPDAWHEWKAFQRMIEEEMREGERFEYLTDWASKLPGAIARIAGLLHCADCDPIAEQEIQIDTMTRALALGAVLCDHALAAFDAMGGLPALEEARQVWRWIERNRVETFTLRDCWHPLRGTFKRVKFIEPAFEILLERRYLFRIDPQGESGGPGRPSSPRYVVNAMLSREWD